MNRRGLNAGQTGLSESRRDSLGDDEVPFIDEMIDVLLAHLAQFRDQWGDRFRTGTTGAARIPEPIGLAVVHPAVEAGSRYAHDQPVGRVEFFQAVFSIQPFEGLHPACSKPFEKGVQTFILDRKTQRDTEVDIITPCVSVCARRERDVEEVALREQPPGAIACVMTEKERNEQKVLHMLSGLFSVSSER
jgi:hypothetical protein